jgi:hypothetical protein
MKLYLAFLLFVSIILPNDNKKISISIYDYDKPEWWSKFNNNGLNFTQSNISLSYKNIFDNYDILLNTHLSNEKLIVGESYISFYPSDLYKIKFGRYYKDFSSYLNNQLSSGSMLIGTNALPIPKFGLLGEYQFKGKNNFKFSFGLAHSVLDKNDVYDESPFIHEKFLYLIRNSDNYEFGAGFVHEAIWNGSTFRDGRFPDSFSDFLKIIISADGDYVEGKPHANALGNHLGIWDFYYFKKNTKNSLKFYYQHFFEDTSGLRFHNRSDGLWGFEFQNLSSKFNLLLEYINTSNQKREPPYVDEDYYNHTEYTLGWTYKGYVIGNPFVNNVPAKVIYAGLENSDINNFRLKILLSKRVDTYDIINYSFYIGKVLQNFTTSLFVNGGKSKNIGLRILYDI